VKPLGNIHPTADVAESAIVPPSARIWHYAQIREGATLGENCIVGRGAYIGTDVVVGADSKIQNYALIYEPAELGSGVFVGPAVVLTNDEFPRAVGVDGSQKTVSDWHPVGVTVGDGASIGARAVCVAPVRIGKWALVGAGAVVVHDVPDYALVVGSPARRIGWVGEAGIPLVGDHGQWRCPQTDRRYHELPSGELVPSEVTL